MLLSKPRIVYANVLGILGISSPGLFPFFMGFLLFVCFRLVCFTLNIDIYLMSESLVCHCASFILFSRLDNEN